MLYGGKYVFGSDCWRTVRTGVLVGAEKSLVAMTFIGTNDLVCEQFFS